MGYAGGRFAGIAFTAERTLQAGPSAAATSVRPEGWAEQSGTIVHGALATLGIEAETVLWERRAGAGPHRPGEPLSNCKKKISDIRAGAERLGELIERLRPRALVSPCGGRSAERALADLGLDCDACVRHPTAARRPSAKGSLRRAADPRRVRAERHPAR